MGKCHADTQGFSFAYALWRCALFVGEEGGGEVAFGGIGQDGDDGLAGAEAPGELEGGEDVRAGGDAGEQPFLLGEVACTAERFLIGDDADV